MSDNGQTPAVLLDINGAINAIKDGKCISKTDWKDPKNFAMLKENTLQIHLDGQWHSWILSRGDLVGQDFYVL